LNVWFLGGLVVLVSESFPLPWGLLLACDCVKCLVFKGLAGGQAYFDELLKYIFTYSQLVIGNLSAMFYLARVASNNGTPTITKLRRYDNCTNSGKRTGKLS
jgi:hypothetical protein